VSRILARVDLHTGERAAALLRDARARCEQAVPPAAAIFDLDSTLLDNRPRQARIMREFGDAHGIPELSAGRPEHWTGWSLTAALIAAGLSRERAAALHGDYRAFWEQRFFTSDYCAIDTALAGAPAFVRAVAATGVRVLYVTGRHEGMRAGTETSMLDAGFPDPDGDAVRLIMKPALQEEDDDFKERMHPKLAELGRIVAVFDNEPAHINGYRAAFPDALSIHLATDHSLREVYVVDGIPSIPDFTAF